MKNIIRPISSLKITALRRKPGYLAECLLLGKVVGENLVEFAPEAHASIRARFSLPRPKPAMRGLGDAVARVATPFARKLRLKCIDQETQELQPDSKCAKRKARLNAIVPFKPSM